MKDFLALHEHISKKYDFQSHLQNQQLVLKREKLDTLQINLGKLCNQACRHCHVDASPLRTEQMNPATAQRLVELMRCSDNLAMVDITGGAPELNPQFRYLAREARQLGLKVIDRCNLTILFEPGQEDLADFLANHQISIVASLPCYLEENVDKQRGRGVFDKSIRALQLLNAKGYGIHGSGLELNLVYNPVGASLPPAQQNLQQQYKDQLRERFGIEFNQLFTITNMPISRFAEQLHRDGRLEEYMNVLVQSFNASAVEGVMCRNLISVSWKGELYDCDFNQMLDMMVPGQQKTIWNIESLNSFNEQTIATGGHCFGCTAGAGSSCGGALI